MSLRLNVSDVHFVRSRSGTTVVEGQYRRNVYIVWRLPLALSANWPSWSWTTSSGLAFGFTVIDIFRILTYLLMSLSFYFGIVWKSFSLNGRALWKHVRTVMTYTLNSRVSSWALCYRNTNLYIYKLRSWRVLSKETCPVISFSLY